MLGYVIGDANMVMGFALVGVEGVEVTSPEEADRALERALDRGDLAIIILSEEFSSHPQMRQKIATVRHQQREPLIIEVPGSKGKPSEIKMSDVISKALGVRI